MTASPSIFGLGIALGLGLGTWSTAATAQPLNPEIQVGIVQRFGENADSTLVLESLTPEPLTLTFETSGQPQTVTTSQVTIETAAIPLAEPALQERVVLSTHRSFESAEDSANQWRQRGIAVEIAQPGTWEVWADRTLYGTPLLRRLLLQNLAQQGYTDPFLDSQVVAEVPKAAFIANGYRYQRDYLTITSPSRIRVVRDPEETPIRVYGGDLRLQPNTYGTYTLVNDIDIETYLRGVVPHEIGLGAPPTTIETQAILARTYALRNLRRFEVDNYELCADTQCQVYWGVGGAAPISDQAILTTRSQVLTYNGELVDALYSSTTGGVTAPFSDVWNGPDRPYLQAVVDSVQNIWDLTRLPLSDEGNFRRFISLDTGFNEDDWDTFRWVFDSPLAEVTQDLKTYLQRLQSPLASFSQVKDLRVVERAESGRVQAVAVETDLGPVVLSKDEIIRVLSAPRSLLFYVEPIFQAADEASERLATGELSESTAPVLKGFRFVGGGRGHGVGMSQTGAYRLGELGWSSQRILSFYYPGTQVRPITSDLTFWREPDAGAVTTEPVP